MSNDTMSNDLLEETTDVADATEKPEDDAETLDELVDVLLDESRTEAEEASGGDAVTPEPDSCEAVAGDAPDGHGGGESEGMTAGDAVEETVPATVTDDGEAGDSHASDVAAETPGEAGAGDSEPDFPQAMTDDQDDFGDDEAPGDFGNESQGDFDDDDMLVSMPQDTTVITSGTVMMLDAEPGDESQGSAGDAPADRYRVSLGATLASLFVGLAIGIVATFLVMNGSSPSSVSDQDTFVAIPRKVDESGLSTEMVTYEYGGEHHTMSIEEVIEATGSLESMADGDGYMVPSAEKAMEAVRDEVVLAEAARHGISVTDGDVLDYISASYGVATVDDLATQVGVDVTEAERQIHDRLVIRLLKNEVTGSQQLLPLVDPPAPDDGDSTAMTERYGEYIRSLAGDEWNATDGAWTNPDGMFAQAFGEMMFDGNVANYDMARMAYDVVRHKNEEIQANIDNAWSNYLGDLFRKVSITIMTVSR